MQRLGLSLIAIGFLGGSLVSVLHRESIDWSYFVPLLVLGIAGVILVQLALRREARDLGRVQANFDTLHASLGSLVENLSRFDASKEDMEVYDIPAHIDHTFREDIYAFADARESIAHTCGMKAYADIMSRFAAGERYLNRVWSCAADGYVDEAHAFIARSHEQFSDAYDRLQALERASTATDEKRPGAPDIDCARG